MQNGIRPRDPVQTGSLHCQGGDGALLKPEDPLLQVGGKGIESAHRVGIKLMGNGYIALVGAHIGTGGMGIDCERRAGKRLFLAVRNSLLLRWIFFPLK